jgi:hypothetical protein
VILAYSFKQYRAHLVLFVEELVLELKEGAIWVAEKVDYEGVKPLVLLLTTFQILLIGYHIGKLVLIFPVDALEVILKFKGTGLGRLVFQDLERGCLSDLCGN